MTSHQHLVVLSTPSSALTSWVITLNLSVLALAGLGLELGLELGIGFRVRVRVRLRVSGPLLAFIPGLPLPKYSANAWSVPEGNYNGLSDERSLL